MSSENHGNQNSENQSELLNLPEFREMKMRAEAAEARLRRIYNTPVWKLTKPIRKIYARIFQAISNRRESKFVFTPNEAEGTPVIDLVKGKIHLETNNAVLSSSSIAIVAHFSNNLKTTESLNKYLQVLIQNGFQVILVSACELAGKLTFESELDKKITIIRKPNLGYDFGSWAVALDRFPEILDSEELLLTNDSLIGPIEAIDDVISKLRNSKFDITGVTDNSQLQYHIQSYLVHFKKSAIKNSNVINLLKSIVHLGLKNDVILKYELGLTRTAQLSGLFVGAIFPWNLIVSPDKNPSLAGWKRLMTLGFPFLKREAVRLGSHSEVNNMKSFIKENYKDADFVLNEIESIS